MGRVFCNLAHEASMALIDINIFHYPDSRTDIIDMIYVTTIRLLLGMRKPLSIKNLTDLTDLMITSKKKQTNIFSGNHFWQGNVIEIRQA